jgi:hypothetical protein
MSSLNVDSPIQELGLSSQTLSYLDAGTIFCIQDIYFCHFRYGHEKYGVTSGLWNCHPNMELLHITEIAEALKKANLPLLDNSIMQEKYLELLALSEEEKRSLLMTEVIKVMRKLNLPIKLGEVDTFAYTCTINWQE